MQKRVKCCRSRQELSNEHLLFTCKNRLRCSRDRASQSLPKLSVELEKKLEKIGGLPTTADCDYRYIHTWNNRTHPIFEEQAGKDIVTFSEDQCWAFSLHDYGYQSGQYLLFYMIFDIGISHGLDLAAPGWWITMFFLTCILTFG